MLGGIFPKALKTVLTLVTSSHHYCHWSECIQASEVRDVLLI
jgi:hypothetical protein